MNTEIDRFTLEEAHTKFAKLTNNETWELLEKEDRTDDEDHRMVMAAYASYYHWLQVGTVIHEQRSEWMLARVFITLGEAKPALAFAQRCLALTEKNKEQMQDFDIAFAYEGIARACALNGNQEEAEKYLKMAEEAGEAIADAEDKEIFVADLNGGEWFGLQ